MPGHTLAAPRDRWVVALVAAALAGLSAWLLAWSGGVAALDRVVLDSAASRSSLPPHTETVLVAIDDASLARLGQWPWSRRTHAQLVDALTTAGARTIAFDIVLAEPDRLDPAGDAALAAAIARSNRVLLALPTVEGRSGTSATMARLWPAARFVHARAPIDADGRVRALRRWMESGSVSVPALPLAVVSPELAVPAAALRTLDARRGVVWADGEEMLVTRLPAPERMHAYSYADVLDGRVDAGIFRDHPVIVGTTAKGLAPVFTVPQSIGEARVMSGSELSTALANSVAGDTGITPATPREQLLTCVPAAVVATLLALLLPGLWRALALGLCIALALTLQWLAVHYGNYWLGTSPAALGMAAAAVLALAAGTRIASLRARALQEESKRLVTGLGEAVVAIDTQGRVVHAEAGRSGLLPEDTTSAFRQPIDQWLATTPALGPLLSVAGPEALARGIEVQLALPGGNEVAVVVHATRSELYTPGGRILTFARATPGTTPVFDPLTSLPTRARLSATLDARAAGGGSDATVLALVALDGFKRVNEALGSQAGDRVLVETARALNRAMPPQVMSARWSGDQFALLIPQGVADAAGGTAAIAQQLHDAVHDIPLEGGSVRLAASVVLVQCTHGEEPVLPQRAERALRELKLQGGGRWRVAGNTDNGWTRETLALENALRQALARGEFCMLYQPIIDARTGRLASMEALVRWRHPERGLLGPDEFVGLMEELGLDIALGETVFGLVHADLQALAARGLYPPVSVNVSARHFERSNFPAMLADTPLVRHARPGQVGVELTETMALLDPVRAQHQVIALREAGVGVALDDFGCGHSSLALLRSLKVRVVKIDRSFTADALGDPGARALVRAIIGMAQALNLRTVAEGVETREQSEWLLGEGCYLHQGYLFARPMDIQSLTAHIASEGA